MELYEVQSNPIVQSQDQMVLVWVRRTEDDILWEEMDESDPFADDDGVESIVDKEGKLFSADEDEVAVLQVNEQEYRDIFGESDFNGF